MVLSEQVGTLKFKSKHISRLCCWNVKRHLQCEFEIEISHFSSPHFFFVGRMLALCVVTEKENYYWLLIGSNRFDRQ